MATNFKQKSEMNTRYTTRATAHYYFVFRVGSLGIKTFFNTAINDWNALPACITENRNENEFK